MRRPVEFSLTGTLPDAPLAMPKQVIEVRSSWFGALRAALLGTPIRS